MKGKHTENCTHMQISSTCQFAKYKYQIGKRSQNVSVKEGQREFGPCVDIIVLLSTGDPLWSSTDNVEEPNLLQQDQTPIEDEQDFKLFLL